MIGIIRGKWKRTGEIWGLMGRRSAEGHISRVRQALESVYLWTRNGVRPSHYMAAGLYRPELSWREKSEHIGARRYLQKLSKFNSKTRDRRSRRDTGYQRVALSQ